LFVGHDFASLEDRVFALTTRDKNKVEFYVDGYDGHSLRSYTYLSEQMPEIRQANPSGRRFNIKTKTGTISCKSGNIIVMPDGSKSPMKEYNDSYQKL
jgi:hypothetical protein